MSEFSAAERSHVHAVIDSLLGGYADAPDLVGDLAREYRERDEQYRYEPAGGDAV